MDAKDLVSLLVQTGAVGLCYFLIRTLGSKMDRLHDAIWKLACLVVDRNARPDDITPPELPTHTPRKGSPRP